MYAGLLDGAERIAHRLPRGRDGWLHVARGGLTLNGERLGPGDGAALIGELELTLSAGDGAEFVFWDLPPHG